MEHRTGRRIAVIGAVLVIAAVLAGALWLRGNQQAAPQEGNLIENADFSAVTGSMPDGWETGMWVTSAGASYL